MSAVSPPTLVLTDWAAAITTVIAVLATPVVLVSAVALLLR